MFAALRSGRQGASVWLIVAMVTSGVKGATLLASKARSFTLVLACSGLATLAIQSPASSAVTIETRGPNTVFGNGQIVSSYSFAAGGIGMTFLNPLAGASNTLSRTVSVGTPTLPGGGTCLGGSREVNLSHVCGNLPENSTAPQIDFIQIVFDQDVFLKSMAITARAQTFDQTVENSVSSLWQSESGSTATFNYSVDTLEDSVVHDTFRTKNYNSTFSSFVALAGKPVSISSTFTNNIDYWITSIQVQRVPGPLPVLGVASAFAWSRRLRRKTQTTTR
jgi:hypothetical protein